MDCHKTTQIQARVVAIEITNMDIGLQNLGFPRKIHYCSWQCGVCNMLPYKVLSAKENSVTCTAKCNLFVQNCPPSPLSMMARKSSITSLYGLREPDIIEQWYSIADQNRKKGWKLSKRPTVIRNGPHSHPPGYWLPANKMENIHMAATDCLTLFISKDCNPWGGIK